MKRLAFLFFSLLIVLVLALSFVGCSGDDDDDDDDDDNDTGDDDDDDIPDFNYVPEDGPYEYFIITDDSLVDTVDLFAGFKQSQGYATVVTALSEVEGNGADLPEDVRNYLIGEYDESLTQYVLLVGSHDAIPMRYFYLESELDDVDGNPAHSIDHEYTTPTDYYYGEMDAEWDVDGDEYLGEWGEDFDGEWEGADWQKDIHVGRIPWDSEQAVGKIIRRMIRYQLVEAKDQNFEVLLTAGEIQFAGDAPTLMYLVKKEIDEDPFAGHIHTLYAENDAYPGDYELHIGNFTRIWNEINPGFVMWASHGSATGAFLSGTGGKFFDIDRVADLDGVSPCVVFSTGCTNSKPEELNLGSVVVRDVAAAFIGSTRVTHPGDYGEAAAVIFPYGIANMLLDNAPMGQVIDNSVDYYMTVMFPKFYDPELFLRNIFGFTLFGDPSMPYRPAS